MHTVTEEEGHLAAYWVVLSKDFLLRTFLCLSPLKFLEGLGSLTDIPKEDSFFFFTVLIFLFFPFLLCKCSTWEVIEYFLWGWPQTWSEVIRFLRCCRGVSQVSDVHTEKVFVYVQGICREKQEAWTCVCVHYLLWLIAGCNSELWSIWGVECSLC